MRRPFFLLLALLLVQGCVSRAPKTTDYGPMAQRLFGADTNPIQYIRQAQADPGSTLWQGLQTPADGPASFGQATFYRIDLAYGPAERLLTGEEGVIYTNRTDRAVARLYLTTEARVWGDAPDIDDRLSVSELLVNGLSCVPRQEQRYAIVDLTAPIQPGASALVTFSFRARIGAAKTPASGWATQGVPVTYGANPQLADGLGDVIPHLRDTVAAMEAEAAGGPPANPDPAIYDLRIKLPEGWRAISGGTTVGVEGKPDAGHVTRILAAANYLPVFATAALEQVSRQVGGVGVIVHHPAGRAAEGQAMLEAVAKLLPVHEQALGPYPFRELEILPIDSGNTFKGMSQSGLIFLAEPLFGPMTVEPPADVTDPWLKRVMSNDHDLLRIDTLSHELAHGWWGDLARPDIARSPWWTEGMTEAVSIAALEKAYGGERAQLRRDRDIYAYRLNRHQGMPDVASGLPLRSPGQVQAYGTMGYMKPALFYDSIRANMEDEAFFAGLRRYIDKGRFTARADRGPVEELLGTPGVAALYQRWMLETHGDEDIGLLTPEQVKQVAAVR